MPRLPCDRGSRRSGTGRHGRRRRVTTSVQVPKHPSLTLGLFFRIKTTLAEKAFTITALATLGLCIGANTAIFTVLNAVVLDPLPYPDSGRLETLYNIYPSAGRRQRPRRAGQNYTIERCS